MAPLITPFWRLIRLIFFVLGLAIGGTSRNAKLSPRSEQAENSLIRCETSFVARITAFAPSRPTATGPKRFILFHKKRHPFKAVQIVELL